MADCQVIIPKGYCQCGCGGKTTIAKTNDKRYGTIKGKPRRFIVGHARKTHKPVSHGDSYCQISVPGHPRAAKNCNYVYEHILIAEKALGKYLPNGSPVHHHSPTQLVICQDQAYHSLLHRRTKAYKSCGHANWRKCRYCRKWDKPENMHIPPNGGMAYHHRCLSHSKNSFLLKALLIFPMN